MKKTAWKKRIKEACIKAGTYREFFDYTIETLADILEKRDDAARAYLDYGAEPLIAYTNKGGSTNLVKNPALILWDDLNKSRACLLAGFGIDTGRLKKDRRRSTEETEAAAD